MKQMTELELETLTEYVETGIDVDLYWYWRNSGLTVEQFAGEHLRLIAISFDRWLRTA